MKRPMIFIVIYLCFGILLNCLFSNVIAITLIFVGIFISVCLIYVKTQYKGTFILYLIFILGFILCYKSKIYDVEKLNKVDTYEGIVIDKDKGIYYDTLTVKLFDDKNYKVLVRTDNQKLNISDVIEFKCVLEPVENNNNRGLYNEYYNLKSDGIHYKANTSDVKYLRTYKNINYYNNEISNKIKKVYDEVLPPTEADIVKALILGSKDNLDNQTIKLYREGGIYHILALSGMHIAILTTFLMFVLNFFIAGKRKNVIVIIFLIFYTLLTGSSISTVRAVIMAIIVLLAPILRRDYDVLSSIATAGVIMLLVNPMMLLTVSFVLTYTSVITIVVLSPKIQDLFSKIAIKTDNKILLKINKNSFDVIAPSISIYLVTNMILVIYFYYFYPYSIFVNLIIAFLIPILLILSFICGILGTISLSLAHFIAPAIYYILVFFEFTSKFFTNLPNSAILIGRPNILFVIGYFLLIFAIFFVAYNKKVTMLVTSLIIMFVSSIINFTTITIFTGDNNIVVIKKDDIVLIDSKTNKGYNAVNFVLSNGEDKVSTIVTADISNTIALHEKEMIENVYIKSDNPLIEELKKRKINYIEVTDSSKFVIDNMTYFILGNNVYIENDDFTFSNIIEYKDVIKTNIENYSIVLQDDYYYDIIINEENFDDVEIKKGTQNIDIYLFKNKMLVR